MVSISWFPQSSSHDAASVTWSRWRGLNELAILMQPPWHSPHHVVSIAQPWRSSLHGAVPQALVFLIKPSIKWSQLHVSLWPGPHNISYDALSIVKPIWSSPHYTAPTVWHNLHDLVLLNQSPNARFFWHKLYSVVLIMVPTTQLCHILSNMLRKIQSPHCSPEDVGPMMCSHNVASVIRPPWSGPYDLLQVPCFVLRESHDKVPITCSTLNGLYQMISKIWSKKQDRRNTWTK